MKGVDARVTVQLRYSSVESSIMADCLNGLEKTFIEIHSTQLISSGVPQHLWSSLFRKLHGQVYDAGEHFQMCHVEYEEGEYEEGDPLWQVVVTDREGINAQHPDSIFLIDHAWTYRADQAVQHLKEIPGLRERMLALMDLTCSETVEADIKNILKAMWKFNGTYKLAHKEEDKHYLPIWYVMDEFGSRIQHCGEPNVRLVPFHFAPHQCCYTLLFPIEDIEEGEEVTRDKIEGIGKQTEEERDALLLPWFAKDLTSHSHVQHEPDEDYFLYERQEGTTPEPLDALPPRTFPLKVFADYSYVCKYLTDPRFTFVESKEEADVLWLVEHFKDYKELRRTPTRMVNQYPFEHLVTVKDMLAVVARRCAPPANKNEDNLEVQCEWLPTTYCLERELVKFVSYFQKREKLGLDNHWIIKPWNLARGLDHTITSDLHHIVRLPATGPKIAQKYLHNPVLFFRDDLNVNVKFDLRYIVMLLSTKPLKVAVYRRFWIRFANKPFTLEDFDDYQKHFTVNNYNDAYLLQYTWSGTLVWWYLQTRCEMFCDEFIEKFNKQYPGHSWEAVETQLFQMIKEVFRGASSREPPFGMPHNVQSKGCYGLDAMLEWKESNSGAKIMQPKILEFNFTPDCKRACEYYPEFYNDIFSVMFLGETEGHNVIVLE